MPIVLRGALEPPRVPGAPTILAVYVYNSGLVVAWSPPGSDGGATVTAYAVTVTLAATGDVAMTTRVDGSATSAVLSPLVNDVSYVVRVAAVNAVGPSSAAASTAVAPSVDAPNLPSTEVPQEPEVPGPPEPVPAPELAAFPAGEAFVPANWLAFDRQEAL